MTDSDPSAGLALKSGNRVLVWGIAAIVLILLAAAAMLFWSLPDANAFNARVERIFVENDALTTGDQIKLLEVLAQSGTAFSAVLTSYRTIIFVLLIFATALLIAALVFLVMILSLNRRMETIQKQGIQVASLIISRSENAVVLNDIHFGGSLGTGYQAIRGSITIPGTKEYGTSHAEVEHRWDQRGERMCWRLDFPLSERRGVWLTIEKQITHVVNWGVVTPGNKETGQVTETQGMRQRFYLSWYRQHMMARLGATERAEEIGLSLSATW